MKKDAKNNERKDSREATDGLHDSPVAAQHARPPDDSDSDSDLILEGDAKLYEAFSRLRAVRVPGKPKLTMEEAMEAATNQYESYCRWKSKGGPLGKLKAWVEGKEVFKALGPPVFDSFNINWPSLNEGVLQITTEYEREQIVLYNLQLQDVPPDPTVYDEPLPNGQHLVLTVMRYVTRAAAAGTSSLSSRTEGFAINIAIQSQPGLTRSFIDADLLDLSKEGGKRREDTEGTKNSRAKLPGRSDTISRHPRWTARVAYSVVLVLLGCLIIQNESLKSLITSTAIAESKAPEPPAGLQTPDNEQRQVEGDPPNEVVLFESPLTLPPVIVTVNTGRYTTVKSEPVRNRRPTAGWQINDLKPTVPSSQKEAAIVTIAAKEPSQTALLASTEVERLTRYKELEERVAAIAALQHIPVRVQNAEMTQAAKTERLRSLFAQAFKASPRFKVLNDSDQAKAELVIGLRFEADERTSGFVFVDIRDSNGKFIWRDFANCMESRPNETFIVDARGLVSSLEQVMNASK